MTPITTAAPQPRRRPRRRTLRIWSLTLLGTAATLGVGACSGPGVPPLQDVWPEAYASVEDATSVAVEGGVAQSGQDIAVSMAGLLDGSSYAGNVAVDGVAIEIIGNTENTYLKPNTAFYEQNGGTQLQDMVGEKWLLTSADEDAFTLPNLWASVMEKIPAGDEFADADYTAEQAELDGEQVHKYTVSNEDTGRPVSVYLSQDNRLLRVEAESGPADSPSPTASPSATASGSPSPTAAESSATGSAAESGTGTLDFSRWDAVEPVEMPAEDEVFAVPGA
ncbi:hypothetical protein [Citricoccus sp. I39-566]|uniref:hypothetical protein n=1 Tax=Citricoccus sp. I39-566 TaxID=3073268 RepID=UPI00286AC6C3|nr:hypothetical protein [Citricoccus sp. I39-566]WMY77686.1 hypothetical protein RE421_12740 [Citricoccus sp. I39-566]